MGFTPFFEITVFANKDNVDYPQIDKRYASMATMLKVVDCASP